MCVYIYARSRMFSYNKYNSPTSIIILIGTFRESMHLPPTNTNNPHLWLSIHVFSCINLAMWGMSAFKCLQLHSHVLLCA